MEISVAHPESCWDLAVVGLGYVGVPLAARAVRSGMRVVGIDIDPERVAGLSADPPDAPGLAAADVAELATDRCRITTDWRYVGSADVVAICVPTPLDAARAPDLEAVTAAATAIAAHLSPGTLVVLESTVWPGTTEELVRPILETTGLLVGRDVQLAYAPERIDPGNTAFGLADTPRVIGGITPACRDRAAAFYGKLVGTAVPVASTRVAEMSKLIENTYRQVNIALVNEITTFSRDLGVDPWDAIDAAATKPFGFQAFRPGPGVGGHCIPVDPCYLSARVRRTGRRFHLAELATAINERMPQHVATRASEVLNRAGRCLNGARVLLVGVTYKPDTADVRETPAAPLTRYLRRAGTHVSYVDPHVPSWQVDDHQVPCAADPLTAASGTDLTIVLQAHAGLPLAGIADRAPLVLDTRGALAPAPHIERL